MRRFTRYGVRQGHHENDTVFAGGGLCIKSYAAAVTGLPVAEVDPDSLPRAWFGEIEHTHKAIDDTLGYANLLIELSRRAGRWSARSRQLGASVRGREMHRRDRSDRAASGPLEQLALVLVTGNLD